MKAEEAGVPRDGMGLQQAPGIYLGVTGKEIPALLGPGAWQFRLSCPMSVGISEPASINKGSESEAILTSMVVTDEVFSLREL